MPATAAAPTSSQDHNWLAPRESHCAAAVAMRTSPGRAIQASIAKPQIRPMRAFLRRRRRNKADASPWRGAPLPPAANWLEILFSRQDGRELFLLLYVIFSAEVSIKKPAGIARPRENCTTLTAARSHASTLE